MNLEGITDEVKIKAVRSSGPGGQHVNKVSSKIVLQFDIKNSNILTSSQKAILTSKLKSRISREGALILSCGQTRSQHKNKELCTLRLLELLRVHLTPPKTRKKTQPSKVSKTQRLALKKLHSLKKANRKAPDW